MSFQRIASLSELNEGTITAREVDGKPIALYLVEGQPLATSDLCTHEECPLSDEGEIEGDEVSCLCHGSRFNVRTGAVLQGPATEPIPVYPVRVESEDVLVDVG
jgi:3-phenylpropionate/trans-cinnamate dioxygenase ferredoxin subunit